MRKIIIITVLVIIGGVAFIFLNGGDGSSDTNGQPAATHSPGDSVDAVDVSEVQEEDAQPSVGIRAGDLAKDFTLTSFGGESVSLSSFRGKVVLIDFWAGWCPFCVGELSDLEAAHQKFGDDLVLLGVHRTRTESVKTGAEFAEDRGVTYLLLQDPDDAVYRFYSGGQNFMPVAYFIDKEGVIADRVLGPKSTQVIELKVSALLAQ